MILHNTSLHFLFYKIKQDNHAFKFMYKSFKQHYSPVINNIAYNRTGIGTKIDIPPSPLHRNTKGYSIFNKLISYFTKKINDIINIIIPNKYKLHKPV